jgi:hypothetical protein
LGGIEVWTWGFRLAKKALYCLSHASVLWLFWRQALLSLDLTRQRFSYFRVLCCFDDRRTKPCSLTCWNGGLNNFLPGLVLNYNPPDLVLVSEQDWLHRVSLVTFLPSLFCRLAWVELLLVILKRFCGI